MGKIENYLDTLSSSEHEELNKEEKIHLARDADFSDERGLLELCMSDLRNTLII